ncbi:transcription antitermination factor NusB [Helicobacter valdiviensis]|uniref:transcription antitermination factor NusB n=1 Tax=Helicobacter valdiviensis TaxID=1458358 RepID=UPI000DA9E447|nr:transcription antitermination factor NusB [Helicobacter valdiviensis]
MATRTQARGAVVQLLYAYGSGNEEIGKFFDEILEEQKIKNAQKEFARGLFLGVLENLSMLDLRIAHQLKSWDFAKIGDMERAILRLGAYEIVCAKQDRAIVINEAIEIAKNFGTENSKKFINGVLDGIAKNLHIPLEDIK